MLVLTARDAIDDKVMNFEAGADDYLTKPSSISPDCWCASRPFCLRRTPVEAEADVLRIADLELNRLTQRGQAQRPSGSATSPQRNTLLVFEDISCVLGPAECSRGP